MSFAPNLADRESWAQSALPHDKPSTPDGLYKIAFRHLFEPQRPDEIRSGIHANVDKHWREAAA